MMKFIGKIYAKAFILIIAFCGAIQASQQKLVTELQNIINPGRGRFNLTEQQIIDQIKKADPELYSFRAQAVITFRDLLMDLDDLLTIINAPQGYSAQNAARVKQKLSELKQFFEYSVPQKILTGNSPTARGYSAMLAALQILEKDFPQ